jgi:hypothetical protein
MCSGSIFKLYLQLWDWQGKREEAYVQGFGGRSRSKETAWETWK